MPTLLVVQEHNRTTSRSEYRYLFTPKHHGGDARAARWLESLTLNEEFRVFDRADQNQLFDESNNLYGVRPDGNGSLFPLGEWGEQVAEFPNARAGDAWHGYPVYPLDGQGPANRQGQQGRPAVVVFAKMVEAGLITKSQSRRLKGGNHI